MGTIATGHVRCPVCGTHSVDASIHDEAGMCTCACGHRAYAGYVAELAALEARSGWLTDRIRDGQPPPSELMGPYRIWPPPAPPATVAQAVAATTDADASAEDGTAVPTELIGWPVPPGSEGPGRRGAGAGVQHLLLSLGALMLIVAATIFAAVVWDRLGAFGQVAAMVVLTCGVAGLAVWLRSRLRGTAEALAVVAAGLLVVDVVAAPLLGLLPPRWLEPPTLYPAVMAAAVGGTLIAAARRSGLRAWEWLGWGAVPVAGFLVLGAVDTGASPAVAVGLLSVPALASILMLARARVGGPVREPVAMALAGGAGLTMAALLTAGAVTSRPALPGALVTTVVATLAFWAWARMDRSGWVRLMAAALIGAAGAVMLLLPATQELWLAVLVAVAGLAAGALAGWFDSRSAHGREPLALSGLGLRWPVGWAAVPTTAACTLWLCWSVGRTQAGYLLPSPGGTSSQVALLAATVAVIGFAAASRLPGAPWIAALLGEYAWLEVVAPVDVVEVATVPFAAMLLLAGLLWRRYRRPVEAPPSILWLGPAVTVGLIPSALATWAAPWVTDWTDAATGPALLRLGVLLAVSVASVLAGARWGLAGLLLPASVALTIATLAQTWAGLEALPRWVGFGLAGTLLVLGGARIEWLRSQGDRAGTWLRDLH